MLLRKNILLLLPMLTMPLAAHAGESEGKGAVNREMIVTTGPNQEFLRFFAWVAYMNTRDNGGEEIDPVQLTRLRSAQQLLAPQRAMLALQQPQPRQKKSCCSCIVL